MNNSPLVELLDLGPFISPSSVLWENEWKGTSSDTNTPLSLWGSQGDVSSAAWPQVDSFSFRSPEY